MVDAFRSMLDELMGKERDVPLSKRSNKALTFEDKDVCKYELVALCPNTLFRNTKSDLGSCGFEIHDDHLEWANVKSQWDKLSQREKDRYPYERDLIRYLEQLIREMDLKIRKNKERAEAESRPRVLKLDDQRRLDEIKGRQADAVARAAQLGEEGDVDGALEATQAAEALSRQHDTLQKQLTEPERSMTVCDICGVFINSTDNDQRRLDHLTGKQYLGWKKIRETYADIIKARDERLRAGGGAPPPDAAAAEPQQPHRSRSRSQGPSRGRSRERSRERSRSRGRDRERERDRERDYRSSRDRDYRDHDHRRSGSRGYDSRDRDYRDYRDRRSGGSSRRYDDDYRRY